MLIFREIVKDINIASVHQKYVFTKKLFYPKIRKTLTEAITLLKMFSH